MAKKEKVYRRMPDGKETTIFEEYSDAWHKFSDPIEEKLGLRMYAYDPGFLFVDRENPNWGAIDIPLWLAERLVKSWEK